MPKYRVLRKFEIAYAYEIEADSSNEAGEIAIKQLEENGYMGEELAGGKQTYVYATHLIRED